MGSRNFQSQSSSYVGLLNSQQGSRVDETSGELKIPPFSSQQAEQTPVDTPVDRNARRKWSPADDAVLISAWLNTSKDAVVGNEQKLGAFWKRVGDYYAASPHRDRGDLTCKKRWHRINDQVTKFCGAYSAAERQIESGESDTDVLKKAHDIFYSDQQTKFTLEHAWCVLRFEQKWLSLNTPKATPTSKRKDGETDTSAAVPDHEIRLEGCKAAKQKRSTVQGKSVAGYTTIWEMKKEDLATQERLSKLAILDTLLAKKEPLSEAEEDGSYSEMEDLIRRHQAELSLHASSRVQYPPQPEVEFGIPQTCYCGAKPLLETSRNDPVLRVFTTCRRYYTCENVDDGECHVWKCDIETDQRLARVEKIVGDIGKEQSKLRLGFEYFVSAMIVVTVLLGIVLMV
ncbi:hypothetical protein F2Q69_00009674, partial [Brassica cretica]